jgi:hypothetical protein
LSLPFAALAGLSISSALQLNLLVNFAARQFAASNILFFWIIIFYFKIYFCSRTKYYFCGTHCEIRWFTPGSLTRALRNKVLNKKEEETRRVVHDKNETFNFLSEHLQIGQIKERFEWRTCASDTEKAWISCSGVSPPPSSQTKKLELLEELVLFSHHLLFFPFSTYLPLFKSILILMSITGAGKSSLFLALLRLVEAEKDAIFVDDVNIAKLVCCNFCYYKTLDFFFLLYS